MVRHKGGRPSKKDRRTRRHRSGSHTGKKMASRELMLNVGGKVVPVKLRPNETIRKEPETGRLYVFNNAKKTRRRIK